MYWPTTHPHQHRPIDVLADHPTTSTKAHQCSGRPSQNINRGPSMFWPTTPPHQQRPIYVLVDHPTTSTDAHQCSGRSTTLPHQQRPIDVLAHQSITLTEAHHISRGPSMFWSTTPPHQTTIAAGTGMFTKKYKQNNALHQEENKFEQCMHAKRY